MAMRLKEPTPEHKAARDDLLSAMRRHKHLPPLDLLAIAAYTVGQLIALQDQRVVTSAMALDIVGANIEAGNQNAVSDLGKTSTDVAN